MMRDRSIYHVDGLGSLVLLCLLAGCERPTADSTVPAVPEEGLSRPVHRADAVATPSAADAATEPQRELARLLLGDTSAGTRDTRDESSPAATAVTLPTIDPDLLASHGIRILSGRHVQILTDTEQSMAVDGLPGLFDMAVPLWADYFGVADDIADWRMTACVMASRDHFRAAGLLPAELPAIRHGLHYADWIWMDDQATDYFRRHLLLHEGVHAMMHRFLGGTGPPWYREGMADYLATHRLPGGRLQVGIIPRNSEEVAGWGRIDEIRRGFAVGKAQMIRDVMRFRNEDFLLDEPYAWCWGVVAYLDQHPEFQQRFRSMFSQVGDESLTFGRVLEQQFLEELRELDEQWQIFVSHCEYGYDFERNRVRYAAGRPLPDEGGVARVSADHGWQSSGFRLEKDRVYDIQAEGHFQIAKDEQPWISEAGGVTLRYYEGRPLGMLLGNVRLDQPRPGLANLAAPVPVGRRGRIRPVESGTLYLIINDHPAEYADNHGALTVTIRLASEE